jgi:hypothetical protein
LRRGALGKPASQLHAARRALARGRHHVCAVGGGAIADDLGVDLGATGFGGLELLEHHDAAAAGDDEAVAVPVIGAARPLGVSLNFDDMAPMASNSTESVHSSSSPPPANMRSALPSWMVSTALPMQWAEVEQAELIE